MLDAMLVPIGNFFAGFVSWIHSLSPWQIAGILSLMLVDVSRNVGKTIVLIVFKIKRHFRPLRFGTASIANPKISLIIPAHNESVSIKKTILSALENPYQNKEIIIVDDHSTDDTYQQSVSFLERGLIKLEKRSGGKGSRAGSS